MEIKELNMMSDDDWEKMVKKLTSKPERKTRKKTQKKEKHDESIPEIQSRPVPMIQRGSGQLLIRTEPALRVAAIDRGLEVGCSCRIERRAKEKDGSWGLREVENGTVIGIYQHYFIVQIGNHRECFSYNEMFGDDYNKVKVRRKSK